MWLVGLSQPHAEHRSTDTCPSTGSTYRARTSRQNADGYGSQRLPPGSRRFPANSTDELSGDADPRDRRWPQQRDPKAVMATRERAGTWDDRHEAERVAAELNERDRQPEYGELGHDDWIVVKEPK
jgi:hypothetical protein